MRNVIGNTFGSSSPQLVYAGTEDSPINGGYYPFISSPRRKRSSDNRIQLTHIAWTALRNLMARISDKVAASLKDSFESCSSMIHTWITLFLLAFGLPAVISMSLTLWVLSDFLLPRLGIEWVLPVIVNLSRITARAASALLPVPTSSSPSASSTSITPIMPSSNRNSSVSLDQIEIDRRGINEVRLEVFGYEAIQKSDNSNTQNSNIYPRQPSDLIESPHHLMGHPNSGFRVVLNTSSTPASPSSFNSTSIVQGLNDINLLTTRIRHSIAAPDNLSSSFNFGGVFNRIHSTTQSAAKAIESVVKAVATLLKKVVTTCIRFVIYLGHFL